MDKTFGQESTAEEELPSDLADEAEEGGGGLPDIVRRALSLGLSGFFLTEEAVRKALGDTLPKDWADFASERSERMQAEFVERLSYELGRAVENMDFAAVLTQLLEGRTLEVKAQLRLTPAEDGRQRPSVRFESGDRD
jgi:hypothetical protein